MCVRIPLLCRGSFVGGRCYGMVRMREEGCNICKCLLVLVHLHGLFHKGDVDQV